MKVDGDVYLSEIKYCESLSEKLGYSKKVIKMMSSKIYKDPSVSTNNIALKKEADKYLLSEN